MFKPQLISYRAFDWCRKVRRNLLKKNFYHKKNKYFMLFPFCILEYTFWDFVINDKHWIKPFHFDILNPVCEKEKLSLRNIQAWLLIRNWLQLKQSKSLTAKCEVPQKNENLRWSVEISQPPGSPDVLKKFFEEKKLWYLKKNTQWGQFKSTFN